MASKSAYRAKKLSDEDVLFWGEDGCEDCDGDTPITVLSEEKYVKVIYKGRMGLVRQEAVQKVKDQEEEKYEALEKENAAAVSRLGDLFRLPSYPLPLGFEKECPPDYINMIEEAVECGFPVPSGLITKDDVTCVLLAVLQRPHGVRIATEIVSWATDKPALISQIPPLLSDFPREVRAAFFCEARKFLAKSSTDAATWMPLFKAAIGLPPNGSALVSEESSKYQPYGTASKRANFHPEIVFKADVLRIRKMLQTVDDEKFRIMTGTADVRSSDSNSMRRLTEIMTPEGNCKGMVFTRTTSLNIATLCKALQSQVPLLIEGDTGVGKTASVAAAAEKSGRTAIRFNLSSSTTVEDLVGRMQMMKGKLELSRAPFTGAFTDGALLVLDECNLAQEEVLATLETALDTGYLMLPDPSNPARAAKEVRRHPSFRLIITQNPCSGLFAGKRQSLSSAFLSRFHPVTLVDLPRSELVEIAATKIAEALEGNSFTWMDIASMLVNVHKKVVDFVNAHTKTSIATPCTVFSIRDILNSVKLITHGVKENAGGDTPELMMKATQKRFTATMWCVYGIRFHTKKGREELLKIINEEAQRSKDAKDRDPQEAVHRCLKEAKYTRSLPEEGERVWSHQDENVSTPKHPVVVTDRFLDVYKQLDFVADLGRPVLIVGKSGSGISSIALSYAALRTRSHYLCNVNSETVVGNLLGQQVPDTEGKDDAISKWVDGPVTSAVLNGKWLVLDDLLSASATVLERLNSVLEERPELYVAERGPGLDQEIRPKEGFRVLATADLTQLAALSPAFANRFTILTIDNASKSGREKELKLLCSNMLFAPGDIRWSRKASGLYAYPSGKVRVTRAKDKHTNALADVILTGSHEWDVVVGDTCVDNTSVGIALDEEQLDMNQDLNLCPSLWVYCSNGKIAHGTDEQNIGVLGEPYSKGDVISVRVHCNEEIVQFFKNGKQQGSFSLKGQISKEAPLKPFVGLFTKGSSVTFAFKNQAAKKDGAGEAAKMCANIANGPYSMYSIVRAIQCARRFAASANVNCELTHFRKSLAVTEVSVGWFGSNPVGDPISLKSRGAPAMRAILDVTTKLRESAPSLHPISQRIAWCLHLGLPLLIIDDHRWDINGTLLQNIESVIAAPRSSLTEWLGTILPRSSKQARVSIKKVPGPLLRALTEGKIFSIGGFDCLSGAVQSQLMALIDTGMLLRPGEDAPIAASNGFCLVGECTSSDVDKIGKKFKSRFVRINLPPPKALDYQALLGSGNEKIAEAAAKFPSSGLPMDVRTFKQILMRMQKLETVDEGSSFEFKWCLCYAITILRAAKSRKERTSTLKSLASVFSGELEILSGDDADKLSEALGGASSIKESGKNVTFTSGGLQCTFEGSLEKHPIAKTTLQHVIEIVVSIAHLCACDEPVLLVGPTSCKSLAAKVFSSIIGCNIETVHMTCSTEEGDMLGSIHPFSQPEYAKAVKNEKEMLEARGGSSQNNGWQEAFAAMDKVLEDMNGDEGSTAFAFRDGPLSETVKHGSGVLLKAANLPDPQLFVSLRDVFEKHELPLGILAPPGASVPLKRKVPVVLTSTAGVSYSLPPVFRSYSLLRCPPYSEKDTEHVLTSVLSTTSNAELLTKSIMQTLTAPTLRKMLRWSTFVAKYPPIAGIDECSAFVLGARLLFQQTLTEDDLAKLGWEEEVIKKSLSVLPSDTKLPDIGSYKPMAQYITSRDDVLEVHDHTDLVLGVARCFSPDEIAQRKQDTPMVPIPSLLKNLASVFAASILRMPLLLEGAPGIGKSFIVESTANLLGCEFVRVQFSAGTTVAHLFGAPMPTMENGVRVFKRREGQLGAALSRAQENKEYWILLDELNLAPPEVQQALSPMLEEGIDDMTIPGSRDKQSLKHIRVFAAVNPAKVGGGRSHLPPSIKDLFTVLSLHDLGCEEGLHIAKHKFHSVLDLEANSQLEVQLLEQLSYIHTNVTTLLVEGKLGIDRETHTSIVNLRTLEKVILLLGARLGKHASVALRLQPEGEQEAKIKNFFIQVIEVIYKWRFSSPADRNIVTQVIQDTAQNLGAQVDAAPEIQAFGHGETVMFGQAGMLRSSHESSSTPLPPSGELQHRLSALAAASGSTLAVLLEGPTASGKTALVSELARICGQKLRIIPITPNTEISELLGMWVPWKGLSDNTPYELYESLGHEASRIAAAYISADAPASLTEEERKQHDEKVSSIREALLKHLELLSRGKGYRTRLSRSTNEVCKALSDTLWGPSARRLEELQDASSDGTSFHFAESQLIHAMQDGDWVLLDNIDWAPPAAIERLNSLLEADASFTLTERGDNEVRVTKDNGIHKNFRMFFTSNPTRKHAAKLSSAFLNRVVRLSLKSFGTDELKEGPGEDSTGLPNLLFSCLDPDSPDIRFWQYVFTSFHKRAQTLSPDICVRALQHCIERWREDVAAFSKSHSSLFLLCSNLLSTYTQLIPSEKYALWGTLREVLAEAHILNWKPKRRSSVPPPPEPEKEEENNEPVEPEPESEPASEEEQNNLYLSDDTYDESDESGDDVEVNAEAALDENDDGINTGNDKIAIPGRIKKMQEACLANLRQETLAEKFTENNYSGYGKEQLEELATDLSKMWVEKQGGVVEELLDNLSAPPGIRKEAALINMTDHQCQQHKKHYKNIEPVHILCMRLYTMEGPDIDSAMGFENVPKWDFAGTEEQKKNFRDYKSNFRTDDADALRNPTLYKVINRAMRESMSDSKKLRLEAQLVLKKWVRFVCILITLCETFPNEITVHRGVNVPKEVCDEALKWGPGDYIGWASATSTSRRQVGEFCSLGCGEKLTFTVRGINRGFDMQHISAYPGEEEVLLPPFSLLKVTKVFMNQANKTCEVELSLSSLICWDDPTLFSFLKKVLHDAKQSVGRLKRILSRHKTKTDARLTNVQNMALPDATVIERLCAPLELIRDEVAATSEGTPSANVVSTRLPDGIIAVAQAGCDDARGAIGKKVIPNEHELCKLFSYPPQESSIDAFGSFLPYNVFTRAEAASSGVELHIPGLIKAMTTNFTYNKVFARRTAGGRRSYSVAIAFDVSCVTDEQAAVYIRLFAHLRNSMVSLDVDPAVIVYHGSAAACVHTAGDWDNYSVHQFVGSVYKMAESSPDTMGSLGDPLIMAASIVHELKGKKKYVFIITPGQTPSGDPEVSEALHICEANSIELIGIGLDAHVHMAMPKAFSVTKPELLGHGLARLMQGPYAPPTAGDAGQVEVEEKQVFWGRHHLPIVISGFAAKMPSSTVPPMMHGAVLSDEIVAQGADAKWTVKVTGGAFLGIGSNKVHLKVDATKISKDDGIVFPTAGGTSEFHTYIVSLDMRARRLDVTYTSDNSVKTATVSQTEAQLLVCFGSKGGEVVCIPDNTSDEADATEGLVLDAGNMITIKDSVWSKDESLEVLCEGFVNKPNGYQEIVFDVGQVVKRFGTVEKYDIKLLMETAGENATSATVCEEIKTKGLSVFDTASKYIVFSHHDNTWTKASIEATDGEWLGVSREQTQTGEENPFGTKFYVVLSVKKNEGATPPVNKFSFPKPWVVTQPFDVLNKKAVLYNAVTGKQIPMSSGAKKMWVFTQCSSRNTNINMTLGIVPTDSVDKMNEVTNQISIQHKDDAEGEPMSYRIGGSGKTWTLLLPSTKLCVYLDTAEKKIHFGVGNEVILTQDIPNTVKEVCPFAFGGVASVMQKPYKLPEGDKSWLKKSTVLEASGDTLTCGKNQYQAAMRGPITSGVHEWGVTISNGVNGSTVGVCTSECKVDETMYRKPTTWILSNHGKASHDTAKFFEHTAFPLEAKIVCYLNMDERTLSFSINGDAVGEKFTDLPDSVHPLIGLYTSGSKAVFSQRSNTKEESNWEWTRTGTSLTQVNTQRIKMTGQEASFSNALGPVVGENEELAFKVAYNGSSNGCHVGVVMDAPGDLKLDEPIFRKQGTVVYSNHGTLVEANSSKMNDQWPKKDTTMEVSITRKHVEFTLLLPDGNKKKRVQKKTIPRVGKAVTPVVGVYEKGVEVLINGGEGKPVKTPAAPQEAPIASDDDVASVPEPPVLPQDDDVASMPDGPALPQGDDDEEPPVKPARSRRSRKASI